MPHQCRSNWMGGIAGLATLILLTACGDTEENAYQAPPPPAVTAIKPTPHVFTPYQDIVATVRPEETIEVRARVSGFLKTRNFTPGQEVTEGQVLFTLEADEYVAAVNGAKADLAAAEEDKKAGLKGGFICVGTLWFGANTVENVHQFQRVLCVVAESPYRPAWRCGLCR